MMKTFYRGIAWNSQLPVSKQWLAGFWSWLAKGTKENISSFSNAVWKGSVICINTLLKEKSWAQLCRFEWLGSQSFDHLNTLASVGPLFEEAWEAWPWRKYLGGGLGSLKTKKKAKPFLPSFCFCLCFKVWAPPPVPVTMSVTSAVNLCHDGFLCLWNWKPINPPSFKLSWVWCLITTAEVLKR